MAESEPLVIFMLSFSLLLVIISAVQCYTRNFITPGVTILMFFGAALASVPYVGFKVEEFLQIYWTDSWYHFTGYYSNFNFWMWTQIKHRTDKKEAVPIGFFCNYWSNNNYHNHRNRSYQCISRSICRCLAIWGYSGSHSSCSCRSVSYSKNFRFHTNLTQSLKESHYLMMRLELSLLTLLKE